MSTFFPLALNPWLPTASPDVVQRVQAVKSKNITLHRSSGGQAWEALTFPAAFPSSHIQESESTPSVRSL